MNKWRSSHPQTSPRWSPLEIEHSVKCFFSRGLSLVVVPGQFVVLGPILLNSVHSVNDSLTYLPPLLFSAVVFNTGVGTNESDFA